MVRFKGRAWKQPKLTERTRALLLPADALVAPVPEESLDSSTSKGLGSKIRKLKGKRRKDSSTSVAAVARSGGTESG